MAASASGQSVSEIMRLEPDGEVIHGNMSALTVIRSGIRPTARDDLDLVDAVKAVAELDEGLVLVKRERLHTHLLAIVEGDHLDVQIVGPCRREVAAVQIEVATGRAEAGGSPNSL